MTKPLTPINLLHCALRVPGLLLYFFAHGAGYLWGHTASGFMDGKIDAYRETE